MKAEEQMDSVTQSRGAFRSSPLRFMRGRVLSLRKVWVAPCLCLAVQLCGVGEGSGVLPGTFTHVPTYATQSWTQSQEPDGRTGWWKAAVDRRIQTPQAFMDPVQRGSLASFAPGYEQPAQWMQNQPSHMNSMLSSAGLQEQPHVCEEIPAYFPPAHVQLRYFLWLSSCISRARFWILLSVRRQAVPIASCFTWSGHLQRPWS